MNGLNEANGAQSNTPVAPSITASVVSRQFLEFYYKTLSESPQLLHRFYNDDSIFARAHEGEKFTESDNVVGQQNIHEKVQSLNLEKCKVLIQSVISQESAEGCVVVMVNGVMTLKSQFPRRFAQTFLLAPQSKEHRTSFYVRNDMLLFTATIDAAEQAKKPVAADHSSDVSNESQNQPSPSQQQVESQILESSPVAVESVSPRPVRESTPSPTEENSASEPVLTNENVATETTTATNAVEEFSQPEEKVESVVSEKESNEENNASVENEIPTEVTTPPSTTVADAVTPSKSTENESNAAADLTANASENVKRDGPTKGPMRKQSRGSKPIPPKDTSASNAGNTATNATSANTESRPTTWASLFKSSGSSFIGQTNVPVPNVSSSVQTPPPPQSQSQPQPSPQQPLVNEEIENTKEKKQPNNRNENESKFASSAVYVRDLPEGTREADIRKEFSRFGEVKTIDLPNNKNYCFVHYSSSNAVDACIAAASISINGTQISVDRRKPSVAHRNDTSNNRGARGGRGSNGANTRFRPRTDSSNGPANTTNNPNAGKRNTSALQNGHNNKTRSRK